MRKGSLFGVCVLVVIMAFSLSGRAHAETIKIGINAPLTGDIPKVGEGTKFAAQMWLEDVKAAGGLAVGKKKYTVELVLEDNESKAESAVKVATKMITEDGVLVMIGPQSSKQAIGPEFVRFRAVASLGALDLDLRPCLDRFSALLDRPVDLSGLRGCAGYRET